MGRRRVPKSHANPQDEAFDRMTEQMAREQGEVFGLAESSEDGDEDDDGAGEVDLDRGVPMFDIGNDNGEAQNRRVSS